MRPYKIETHLRTEYRYASSPKQARYFVWRAYKAVGCSRISWAMTANWTVSAVSRGDEEDRMRASLGTRQPPGPGAAKR